MTDRERIQFEAWAREPGEKSSWPEDAFVRNSDVGYYEEITLELAWEVWQASAVDARVKLRTLTEAAANLHATRTEVPWNSQAMMDAMNEFEKAFRAALAPQEAPKEKTDATRG